MSRVFHICAGVCQGGILLPMRSYASEVTDPKTSDLAMLDSLINRAVFKIFKVSEKIVIYDIRHFLGLHDVASLW